MNYCYLTLLYLSFLSLPIHSQTQDTLVDVGGYKMHFKIIKGKGTPILFESGAGNDGAIWDNILEKIHKVTGTTLITYDRSGFGQSEVNPNLINESDFGIENGMKELETGLTKLGYDDELILVPHSYGGFYTTLYASRHPEKVKYVVRIDANLVDVYTDDVLEIMAQQPAPPKTPETLGNYYLVKTYPETVKLLREVKFPASVPVIDIISPINRGYPDKYWTLIKKVHKDFVNAETNRVEIIAEGSGHYIFQDNPALIINTIIKVYAETIEENSRLELYEKALDNAIELSIETKVNNRSEQDLNALGYTFLANDELDKALEIFKLTTWLFPDSFNVYDSYGEALLKANRKEEAIEMYKKSIALNPENEHGKKVLLQLKQ
ncbi:alpha/beta fold hydrolase [Maribacter litoralis]|uniref:alpha/beta fold hydrolase n=1 Tax=Maribacter litoralis TaxID=2059726 RepID=UPI0013DF7E27|nr:alpha/beta fold hydrolase [Maribacter litoralis]